MARATGGPSGVQVEPRPLLTHVAAVHLALSIASADTTPCSPPTRTKKIPPSSPRLTCASDFEPLPFVPSRTCPFPFFLHPSTGRRSVWSPGVPSESCLRVEVQVRAENSSRASPKGGRVGSPRRRCLSAPFHVALAISPPDLARAPRPSHSPTALIQVLASDVDQEGGA